MSRYVEVLFRYKLRFVALILLFPAAAAFCSVLLFPWYQASTQLWVNSPSYFGIVPSANGWDQYLTPSQNESDSLYQMLATDAFVGQVGDKLMAQGDFSSTAQRDREMRDLQGKFVVNSLGSHLLVVQVSCRRQRVCVDALSATVDLQREWLTQTERAQATVALDFYTAQAQQATDRLNVSDAAVRQYLVQHPSVRLDDNSPLPSELVILQQKVSDDQKTLKGFQDRLAGINLTSAASDRIEQTILKVIDPPRASGGSLIPSASRKPAMMVGLAALAPGLVYLIVLGWIDRTIRSVREIEGKIGARVIATIPRMKAVDLLLQ